MSTRVIGLVLACCVAASAAIAYGLVSADTDSPGRSALAYNQQTFRATRYVIRDNYVLHAVVVRLRSRAFVEADWYDSSLALLRPQSGVNAALYIDGREAVSSLTGSYFGAGTKGPATLKWSARLDPGDHRFELVLSRVDGGVEAPYVERGHAGVDSLAVASTPLGPS